MKKFVALLLALLLVLVNIAALADSIPDPEVDVDPPATEAEAAAPEYSITKTYTTTGTATDVYPTETLKFTVTPEDDSYPTITVGNNNTLAVDGTTDEYTLAVDVPAASAYGAAGRYHYTVVEATPDDPSQAVEYSDNTFNVDVYVYWKNTADDGETPVLALVREAIIYSGTDMKGANADNDAKDDVFDNTYSVGELTVTKEISGNLADPNKVFTIEITLTSAKNIANDLVIDKTNATTVTGNTDLGQTSYIFTATLKGGQSVTISNIPTGVEYAIEEKNIREIDDTEGNTQIDKVNDADAYAIEYSHESGTIGMTASSETVTNTKDISVPTGIFSDYVPYVLIIALASMMLVALKARKREEN